jgi:hypothetical protein
MMNYWILLFIVIVPNSCKITSSSSQLDILKWTDGDKLRWSDFRGRVPEIALGEASSAVRLRVNYKIDSGLEKFEVDCLFYPNKSWHIDTTEYLLKHEQGHFDICEIFARQLRSKISQLVQQSTTFTEKKIDSICLSYINASRIEQKSYDEETNHAQYESLQSIWNNDIRQRLDSLSKFADFKIK